MRASAAAGGVSAARAAVLAATIALCGCGGSGHAPTQATAQQQSTRQAAARQVSRGTAPLPGKAPTAAVQAPGGQASGAATNGIGQRSFQTLVSTECELAGSGVPGATRGSGSQQGPLTRGRAADAVIRYVVIQRKIAALSRLHPPVSLQVLVRRLVSDLRRLQQLYAIGSRNTAGTLHGAIAATEREAADFARAAGVPGCSPTQTSQPGQPGLPTQPAPVGQPVRPGQPGLPIQPGQPGLPTQPAQVGQPVRSGQPVLPGAP
jgi:hypothetical protein